MTIYLLILTLVRKNKNHKRKRSLSVVNSHKSYTYIGLEVHTKIFLIIKQLLNNFSCIPYDVLKFLFPHVPSEGRGPGIFPLRTRERGRPCPSSGRRSSCSSTARRCAIRLKSQGIQKFSRVLVFSCGWGGGRI